MGLLPGDYIAGFVDGEGCFALKYRTDRKYGREGELTHEYHYWAAEFAIVLHPFDSDLLSKIKDTLRVGRISFANTTEQVRYSVQSISELHETIVPFFSKHSLHGIKKTDFELWKQAVHLIWKHRQTPRSGQARPIKSDTEKQLLELKQEIDRCKRRAGESRVHIPISNQMDQLPTAP